MRKWLFLPRRPAGATEPPTGLVHSPVMDALSAIASPRRRDILRLVWDEELAAGEIAGHFDVSWPAISQHLTALKKAGLLTERRDGKRRLYRADHTAMGPLRAVLEDQWRDDLGRLKALAEAEQRAADDRQDDR